MNRRAFLMASAACGLAAVGAGAYVRLRSLAPSPSFLNTPSPLRLTFDAQRNGRFRDSVITALGQVERALSGTLLLPLSPDNMVDPSGERRAIVHAAVLRAGTVYALFSNWLAGFERPTQMGSISKVCGLLPLAESKPLLLNAHWCRRAAFGFRNANGDRGIASCSTKSMFDADTCIGASDNLAALWAFRQMDQSAMRGKLVDAGIAGVPTDYMPAIAAALGHIELSPLQVLEMFHTLATGQARRCAIVQDAQAAPTRLATWTAEVMAEPQRARRLRQILAAPVFHALGTARHLRAEPVLKQASVVCAKTGTAVNPSGYDVAKVLGLSFVDDSKVPWTLLAMVTSPRPSLPLAGRVSTAAFAPLHRAMLAFTHTP